MLDLISFEAAFAAIKSWQADAQLTLVDPFARIKSTSLFRACAGGRAGAADKVLRGCDERCGVIMASAMTRASLSLRSMLVQKASNDLKKTNDLLCELTSCGGSYEWARTLLAIR